MSNKDNGGPAFPAVRSDLPHGMTIRDWFAGQAMQALVENRQGQQLYEQSLANIAYRVADAMLEARK